MAFYIFYIIREEKQNEAYYYVFNFEMESDGIRVLSRLYHIAEEVMKFIIVRKDEENG